MSQFWQNLHARLQPAVPNDSTLVPGIEVVERLLLDRIDAEARRPAVRREHHRVAARAGARSRCRADRRRAAVARAQVALDATVVGRVPPACRESVIAVMDAGDSSQLVAVDGVAHELGRRRPGSRAAGRALRLQLRRERASTLEQRAPTSPAGTSRGGRRRTARRRRRRRAMLGLAVAIGSSGERIEISTIELVEVGARDRLGARIAQRGGDRVVRDVVDDRAARLERADATLQPAVAQRSVTNVAPGSRAPRARPASRRAAPPSSCAHARARERDEHRAARRRVTRPPRRTRTRRSRRPRRADRRCRRSCADRPARRAGRCRARPERARRCRRRRTPRRRRAAGSSATILSAVASIARAALVVRQVVREVRADRRSASRARPTARRARGRPSAGSARDTTSGTTRACGSSALQERQLDLERVLARVRGRDAPRSPRARSRRRRPRRRRAACAARARPATRGRRQNTRCAGPTSTTRSIGRAATRAKAVAAIGPE